MTHRGSILLVDDEEKILKALGRALRDAGHTVTETASARHGQRLLAERTFDVLIVDNIMPELSGLDLIREFVAAVPEHERPQILMMTAHATVESAIEAMKLGALDYLQKPFEIDELLVVVRRALDHQRLRTEYRYLVSERDEQFDHYGIIGRSRAMQEVIRRAELVAGTKSTVLITGETGTGKEVAARLLHAWSGRPGRFVAINCAAIPNELMEGELFGYARGAFSGAVHEHEGLVSAATGGTVFLDEIDDTPHALQAKLLRVLEDRVVTRLGDTTPRTVDFRLVAATNRDLRPLIEAGSFGADLYERLAIVSIELPPLRQRRDDIPRLVEHFVESFYREEPAAAERGRVRTISPEAMETLGGYRWPGNVRELRNVVFGALVGKRGGTELLLADLPRRLLDARESEEQGVVDGAELQRALGSGTFDLRAEKERLERLALEQALALSRGNAARAAELLGAVGRGEAADPGSTVRAMMRRLGVRATKARGRRSRRS